MAKRSRKRKLENEDGAEAKWELTNILNAELREEMATMWELPQIFHFLHMSNEALNISHLSMYEVERMFAIPRASKQLANIMTCLLSPPLPKAKMRKIPPMPYNFWVNVLIHKVQGWFKIYKSKHQDVIRVLETIGVEPEFWRIFPDASIIDETDFDALSFKQRVWILKTLCDTLMHSRKTVQDAIANQKTEDQYAVVLGADRYGAKYFYFPLFLDNDLRVYRHCIDNTILSTVRPPSWKEIQPSTARSEKNRRGKRKRSRWQNGSLPRDRRRSKKAQDDDVKMSGDSAIGSSLNEDTNFSGTSTCSNNNNIVIETNDSNRSQSPSKDSEDVTAETRLINPKTSGYETNTSMSDAKSLNGNDPEDMFRGFAVENCNENSSDAIESIHDLLGRLTSKVSELEKDENLIDERASTKENSSINGPEDENNKVLSSEIIETKMSDHGLPVSRVESPNDDLNWQPYSPKKSTVFDPETRLKEITIFTTLLDDLSVSTFELAADSVDSLRDLAASLMLPEPSESRKSNVIPKCEMMLARAMEALADSLRDIESKLRESTRKARAKLRKEWTNLQDGIMEDQETSDDPKRTSNQWIIGSQGYPLFSTSETTLQTLSDSALSPIDSDNLVESEDQKINDGEHDTDKESIDDDSQCEDKKRKERRVKIKVEKADSEENDGKGNSDDSQPQTRRVLRARGISSYTEQFTSDEDEDAYELEEWSRVETLNATPSTSDGTSTINVTQKTGQIDDETEEKDSDQDWILPGARKRKRKRSPVNRKLKTLQQKLNSITSDSHDSNVSPPVPEELEKSRTSKSTKDGTSADGSFICKVESVHSELDIKDEGPVFEFARNIGNPSNVQDTYALPYRHPHTLPRLNFPKYPRQPLPPPPPPPAPAPLPPPPPQPPQPGMMPRQMPPGYYVQGPQTYFDPRLIRYSYPPQGRGGPPPYAYPSMPHQYPGQPNYWQPPNYPPLAPGMYAGNPRQPGYPPQRGPPIQQRHQAPSTTLYGARLPTKPPQNRMPVPRPTIPQNVVPRGAAPRPRGMPVQPGQRRYAPRNSVPQAAASRMPRPPRPNANPPTQTGKTKQKSTSLILLSDSDDEIEMIVPEKQIATNANAGQNRKPIANNKTRQAPGAKPRPKPVVTSQITVPKSSELLSPQMIQRMSQGGISITPVKPPASKQKPGETSQGTKLVVVVNETGSHYALALPNGSKLILTPEQVAQIRASNGGKLVL